jgi:hypothetical protein
MRLFGRRWGMKMRIVTVGALAATIVLFASPAAGQVQVLTSNQLARVFNQLNDVDFETLPETDFPDGEPLPNPLRLGGVTFTTPGIMSAAYCSSPTCEPDPDNASGGNMGLILDEGASFSFAQPRRIVVLDLQGNGTNRITFRVVDARGRKRIVVAQTVEFATTIVGLSARDGIRRVDVLRVGSSPEAGPMGLARVLFSDPIPRHRAAPNGGALRWRPRR